MANALAVPLAASVAAGAAVRVHAPSPTSFYFDLGTGTMTVQFQFSADGLIWNNAGAPLAASGIVTITEDFAFVRADTTVFVIIGTASARVVS